MVDKASSPAASGPTQLDALQGILNLFGKSPSTTQTTTKTVDPQAASAALQNLVQSTQGLAALTSGQHAAGLYNSTVNTQLANDFLTRMAGQVAQQSASTSTTTKTAPSIDPRLLGAFVVGKSVLGPTIGKLADKYGLNADDISKHVSGWLDKLTGADDAESGVDFAGSVMAPSAADFSPDFASLGSDFSSPLDALSDFGSSALSFGTDFITGGAGSEIADNLSDLGSAAASFLGFADGGKIPGYADGGKPQQSGRNFDLSIYGDDPVTSIASQLVRGRDYQVPERGAPRAAIGGGDSVIIPQTGGQATSAPATMSAAEAGGRSHAAATALGVSDSTFSAGVAGLAGKGLGTVTSLALGPIAGLAANMLTNYAVKSILANEQEAYVNAILNQEIDPETLAPITKSEEETDTPLAEMAEAPASEAATESTPAVAAESSEAGAASSAGGTTVPGYGVASGGQGNSGGIGIGSGFGLGGSFGYGYGYGAGETSFGVSGYGGGTTSTGDASGTGAGGSTGGESGESGGESGGDGGGFANGGRISGDNYTGVDDKTARMTNGGIVRLSGGERIIPTDVANILGDGFFDALNAMLHIPSQR